MSAIETIQARFDKLRNACDVMISREELAQVVEEFEAMADENAKLRERITSLKAICWQYAHISYNISQVRRTLTPREIESMKALQIEFDKI